jgi:hypothetical protein
MTKMNPVIVVNILAGKATFSARADQSSTTVERCQLLQTYFSLNSRLLSNPGKLFHTTMQKYLYFLLLADVVPNLGLIYIENGREKSGSA